MSLLGGLLGNSSSTDQTAPISIITKSAAGPSLSLGPLSISLPSPPALAFGVDGLLAGGQSLKTFDSYSFERNLLAPGAPFRFTAPGISKDIRNAIRSGDTIQLLATNRDGYQVPVATGFIDQTDTHISAGRVEYVITGRDTIGQLIDNAAVDSKNKVINQQSLTMSGIYQLLILNTRMPQSFSTQQIDNTTSLLFQTNPGETKMNALQRYMELTNSLVWTKPNGTTVLGKPDFLSPVKGVLSVGTIDGGDQIKIGFSTGGSDQATNVLDCRVKRNLNNSIRQIVVQMQNAGQVDAKSYTINNQDSDMQAVASSGVGRSVYDTFTYSAGASGANQLIAVGNMAGFSAIPSQIGKSYALRQIARENVHVLDVEITVQGHFNSQGNLYDVDQVYYCNIPDEDISEQMYCYGITHELTLSHGMITKLMLCKLGTIVAGGYQAPSLGGLF